MAAELKAVEENTVPSWLWRVPAEALDRRRREGRSSTAWPAPGPIGKGGYFDAEADARAFYDEMRFMLAMQLAAPNSPQWFNTGLHWAYGIDGPSPGRLHVDFESELTRSASSYEHPSGMPASSRASPTTW